MVRKTKKPLSKKLWNERLMVLIDSYMIVYSCKSCKSPVNKGYVCIFCDDNDPEHRYDSQTGEKTN